MISGLKYFLSLVSASGTRVFLLNWTSSLGDDDDERPLPIASQLQGMAEICNL